MGCTKWSAYNLHRIPSTTTKRVEEMRLSSVPAMRDPERWTQEQPLAPPHTSHLRYSPAVKVLIQLAQFQDAFVRTNYTCTYNIQLDICLRCPPVSATNRHQPTGLVPIFGYASIVVLDYISQSGRMFVAVP